MEIIETSIFVTKTDGNVMFSLKESLSIWRPQQATSVQACTVICRPWFQWDSFSRLA